LHLLTGDILGVTIQMNCLFSRTLHSINYTKGDFLGILTLATVGSKMFKKTNKQAFVGLNKAICAYNQIKFKK